MSSGKMHESKESKKQMVKEYGMKKAVTKMTTRKSAAKKTGKRK